MRRLWLIVGLAALVGCAQRETLADTGKTDQSEYYASLTVGDTTEFITVSIGIEAIAQYLPYYPTVVSDQLSLREITKDEIIYPICAYYEKMEENFTNSEDFISVYPHYAYSIELIYLYGKGYSLLSNEAMLEPFAFAKASHILIESDYYDQATNMLEYISRSDNVYETFAEVAMEYSADPGSAEFGGSLGYFPKGMMVETFEDAVFGAEKAGLIEEIVPSVFGYHIVYVNEPATDITLKDFSEKIDEMSITDKMLSYYRNIITQLLNNAYVGLVDNVQAHYTFDSESEMITLDNGETYSIYNIPSDIVLYTVFDIDYDWEDCMQVINIYVPGYVDSLNSSLFSSTMTQFENFILFVAKAESEDVLSEPAAQKEIAELSRQQLELIAFDSIFDDIADTAMDIITEEMISNHYDILLEQNSLFDYNFTDDGGYEQFVMSFDEAYQIVYDDLVSSYQMERFTEWSTEMMEKYQVEFYPEGMELLMSGLLEELD